MRVSELKQEMDQRFDQVDERFTRIDQRFEEVDRRFEQVDRRFEQVDRRFAQVEQRITDEGERTRRHFDVVAEAVTAEIRLALDRTMGTAERLDELRTANSAEHVVFGKRLDRHDAQLSRPEKR